MKIKKIGMPIGTTILFYGDFFPFTKKGGWGGVCNNSHKDVFFWEENELNLLDFKVIQTFQFSC